MEQIMFLSGGGNVANHTSLNPGLPADKRDI